MILWLDDTIIGDLRVNNSEVMKLGYEIEKHSFGIGFCLGLNFSCHGEVYIFINFMRKTLSIGWIVDKETEKG